MNKNSYPQAQKCPICNGTGNVPGGFYNHCPGGVPASTNTMEKCRACKNGIVYVYYNTVIDVTDEITSLLKKE